MSKFASAFLVLVLSGTCFGENLLTLEDHKAFFRDVTYLRELLEYERSATNDVTRLQKLKEQALTKDEFETSAQFRQRQTKRDDALEFRIGEYRKNLGSALRSRQKLTDRNPYGPSMIPELVVKMRVTVGPYDADSQEFSKVTPEKTVLGKQKSGHFAIVSWKQDTPGGIMCAVPVARRIREASDKRHLIATIKLKNVRVKLSDEPVDLPTTVTEKVMEGALYFGLALLLEAIEPGSGQNLGARISDTKTVPAYTAQILSVGSAAFIGLADSSGPIQ